MGSNRSIGWKWMFHTSARAGVCQLKKMLWDGKKWECIGVYKK